MRRLDQELAGLTRRLVEMGDLAETMIDIAVRGLMKLDQDTLNEVLVKEDVLDRMQVEIDDEVVRILALYGPLAIDLRFVMMVSKVNTELERIGDQAVNISEYVRLLNAHPDSSSLRDYPPMAKLARNMLRDALQAFYERDAAKAKEVMAMDDLVDAHNDTILRERLAEEPTDLANSIALILIARSLERVADQATNICEEVIYMVEGRDVRHTGFGHHESV